MNRCYRFYTMSSQPSHRTSLSRLLQLAVSPRQRQVLTCIHYSLLRKAYRVKTILHTSRTLHHCNCPSLWLQRQSQRTNHPQQRIQAPLLSRRRTDLVVSCVSFRRVRRLECSRGYEGKLLRLNKAVGSEAMDRLPEDGVTAGQPPQTVQV